ncbi:hypothetical protein DPMN_026092 [Dreissena polymorpha]|uniref:Uncharacterized protein n=1 Tax=Dreissena polymorpha TaxID=45954 RepID=A0A9D4RCF0_DREPO|nr:hypothetical protein DPMN_026092 [Dreissena polymorpha]
MSPVMSPVRSCHRSGHFNGPVRSPVRSLITAPVNSHQLGLPPITPVTGQEEELGLLH